MKQKDIVSKIRRLGCKVTILNSSFMNRKGLPDCLISFNGNAAFLEIKIDKDHLSKLQIEFAEEFFMCTFVLHYDTKTGDYRLDYSEFPDIVLRGKMITLKNKLNDAN